MSKKTWTLIACLVLSLALGLGGSLAYLTDTDTKVNTFTMGNVKIEVVENFVNESLLKPGQTVNKDAWIKNTGTNDAWVWMTVSVPSEIADVIYLNWCEGVTPKYVTENVKGENNATYTVYTVLVEEALAVGATSKQILDSVTMASTVDYDTETGKYYKVVAGVETEINYDLSKFDVIVTGYAIQKDGIIDINAAYAHFGQQWNGTTPPSDDDSGEDDQPTVTWTEVATLDALKAAIVDGAHLKLTDAITTSEAITIPENTTVVIDLNDKTLAVDTTAYVIRNKGTLTITGGTVQGQAQRYAIYNEAVLTIDGATVKGVNQSPYGWLAIQNANDVTIQGNSKIEGDVVNTNTEGIITITGGTFTFDPSTYVPTGYTVTKNADGTWTVN